MILLYNCLLYNEPLRFTDRCTTLNTIHIQMEYTLINTLINILIQQICYSCELLLILLLNSVISNKIKVHFLLRS